MVHLKVITAETSYQQKQVKMQEIICFVTQPTPLCIKMIVNHLKTITAVTTKVFRTRQERDKCANLG